MHFTQAVGMYPNQDFPTVVEANISKDAQLVVGCKTGMRSARACEMLSQMGFDNIANIRGGFVGVVDNTGKVVEPGWSMLNLPISTDAEPQQRYENLVENTRK
jgi:predicted sulfurtransferase